MCLGDTVCPAFQQHFECIYVFTYFHVCVCSCMYLCASMHALCAACTLQNLCTPVFVCMLVCECEETTEGRPTESTAFRKRCQNEFVTESVNLRRKGTAERERLSPGTQSLSD